MPASKRRRESGMTLIEVLIGMSIMTVVTAMLLMGWFSLQQSYSRTAASSDQRDSGRQTLSRMQRELRDAEAMPLPNIDPAIYRARPYWTAFYTTFNVAGNTVVNTTPHMVMYRLYRNGELWRFSDTHNNGTISGVDMAPSPDDPRGWDISETTTGDGAQLLLGNVTNFSAADPSGSTPLFRYMYYDDTGTLVTADHAYNWIGTDGQGHNDRSNTVAVIIRALVDLVPGHSPVAADLQVTAQLRNQR